MLVSTSNSGAMGSRQLILAEHPTFPERDETCPVNCCLVDFVQSGHSEEHRCLPTAAQERALQAAQGLSLADCLSERSFH